MAGMAVVGCLLCQTGCGMLYGYYQGKVNYEMAADWLLEHGYTQGYATYWNAYTIEEASNGRITMRALDGSNWQRHCLCRRGDREFHCGYHPVRAVDAESGHYL